MRCSSTSCRIKWRMYSLYACFYGSSFTCRCCCCCGGDHVQSLASQLFAMSLFPYLAFLFFLHRSGKAPKLTLIGFYFLLAFVGATIPAGIYGEQLQQWLTAAIHRHSSTASCMYAMLLCTSHVLVCRWCSRAPTQQVPSCTASASMQIRVLCSSSELLVHSRGCRT